MKLYGSLTSPFVRKCRITAIECDVMDRIEMHIVSVLEQTGDHPNPLGLVPSLITQDHGLIVDSRVICDYLASLRSGLADGSNWADKTLLAMADGVTDRAVSLTLERRRPESDQSEAWITRWTNTIRATLPHLNHRLPNAFTPGAVALTCALAYLDLRHEAIAWRDGHEQMADWFADQGKRTSVIETEHPV